MSDEWQPIGTAPHDTTFILACHEGQPDSVRMVYSDLKNTGWWSAYGSGWYPAKAFTHWMPLPEPPKGGTETINKMVSHDD